MFDKDFGHAIETTGPGTNTARKAPGKGAALSGALQSKFRGVRLERGVFAQEQFEQRVHAHFDISIIFIGQDLVHHEDEFDAGFDKERGGVVVIIIVAGGDGPVPKSSGKNGTIDGAIQLVEHGIVKGILVGRQFLDRHSVAAENFQMSIGAGLFEGGGVESLRIIDPGSSRSQSHPDRPSSIVPRNGKGGKVGRGNDGPFIVGIR
mmetsp:Transcript_16828/g.36694  ORF Transcript_16828/g.36694 Transcript_16828/m.36694 type:complete len:206 (-) Transcript_16828:741-1358(-)